MINFDQPSLSSSEEETKTNNNIELDVESFKKEETFLKDLENQGFLGEKIKEDYLEIKNGYKQQLIEMDKSPAEGETWDDLIRKEIDENYAKYIKEKVSEDDKRLVDNFLESDKNNPLSLNEKQEFLNVLFRNNNLLYANEKGEMVSMADYLKEYYKDIGVDVGIEFKTINPDVKKDLAKKILRSEFLEKDIDRKQAFEKAFYAVELGNKDSEEINYILNDEVAFPHLIVKTKEIKKEIPLVAGSSDYHSPLRSEERDKSGERKRKRKGHFIQLQTIHAPEFGCGIQKITFSSIHEIDHAVREVLPTKNQNLLDKELLTEGTAEKAGMDFISTQHKYLKDKSLIKNYDGYDYQTNLWQALSRRMVGEMTDKNQEHRYAQGLMIAEQYSRNKGEKNYKKLFYTGELDVENELGDVVKIREGIDEKLKPQKKMFTQILTGRLDKK